MSRTKQNDAGGTEPRDTAPAVPPAIPDPEAARLAGLRERRDSLLRARTAAREGLRMAQERRASRDTSPEGKQAAREQWQRAISDKAARFAARPNKGE